MVPSKITKEARGTPATPLDVIIKVNTINNCCPIDKSILQACATKILAKDRYKVVPSKLKLYPKGMTKETIFRGTPNFSMLRIALGKALSELAVANANVTGSDKALNRFLIF